MVWTINWNEKALKDLKKLAKPVQIKILKFLNRRIAYQENPRMFGKALSFDKRGLWRYRVEDFRIICQINDEELLILVVKLGHRKEVYRN